MANQNPGPAIASSVTNFAPMTNITLGGVYAVALAPGSVPANSTGTLVTGALGLGLQVGDFISIQQQGANTAGTFAVNAWVSAADILSVTFANITSAAATPTNGTYYILVDRPDTKNNYVNSVFTNGIPPLNP